MSSLFLTREHQRSEGSGEFEIELLSLLRGILLAADQMSNDEQKEKIRCRSFAGVVSQILLGNEVKVRASLAARRRQLTQS